MRQIWPHYYLIYRANKNHLHIEKEDEIGVVIMNYEHRPLRLKSGCRIINVDWAFKKSP